MLVQAREITWCGHENRKHGCSHRQRSPAQALPDGLRLLPLHRPVRRHHFALTRLSARSDAGISRILELLEDNATRLLAQHSTAKATPRSATAS